MGYKISKNQRKLNPGFIRYDFYLNYDKSKAPARNTFIHRKSAVDSAYSDWVNQILAKAESEKNRGKTPERKLFEILDEYLIYSESFKSERMYKHERTIIEDVVKKFYDPSMNLASFNRADAEAFILWRKNKVIVKYENTKTRGQLSNSTINRNIAVLSYFFNWCIKKSYYEKLNPFSMTKHRENNYREIMMNQNQIEELLSCAISISETFHKVISILLLSGMRRGELFSLEWSEVNFDTSFIMLSKYKTKGRKGRAIPISPALREILLSLRNSNAGNMVMANYTVNILAKDWNKLLGKISFPVINDGTKLRVHDLRHVYSQSLLNMGVSLEDMQSLLGHQDITTTQRRYAQHARPDLLQKGSLIDNVICIRKAI